MDWKQAIQTFIQANFNVLWLSTDFFAQIRFTSLQIN